MFGGTIQPLGRMLDAEEMGTTLAFMASNQATAFIAGIVFPDAGIFSIYRGIGIDPAIKCP